MSVAEMGGRPFHEQARDLRRTRHPREGVFVQAKHGVFFIPPSAAGALSITGAASFRCSGSPVEAGLLESCRARDEQRDVPTSHLRHGLEDHGTGVRDHQEGQAPGVLCVHERQDVEGRCELRRDRRRHGEVGVPVARIRQHIEAEESGEDLDACILFDGALGNQDVDEAGGSAQGDLRGLLYRAIPPRPRSRAGSRRKALVQGNSAASRAPERMSLGQDQGWYPVG